MTTLIRRLKTVALMATPVAATIIAAAPRARF